jgi:hypothetical protein
MEPTRGKGGVEDQSVHGRMGLGTACNKEETFMLNQFCDWNKDNNIQNKIHIQL